VVHKEHVHNLESKLQILTVQ
jgi:hypothetical protein